MPPFNDENMIMLSAAAKVAAPALAARFDARQPRLPCGAGARTAPAPSPPRRGWRRRARAVGDAFAARGFSRAETFAIFDAIAGNAVSPRFTDYDGSVQAVMAADTLLNALVAKAARSTGQAAGAIRADIDRAYHAVRDPNAYRSGANSAQRSAAPRRRSGGCE